MPSASPSVVAGFEIPPRGRLLAQLVDFRHRHGVAYERCIGYFKDFHTHDRVNVAFPRAGSRIEFRTQGPVSRQVVDDRSFIWMPTGQIHSQDTLSAVYDNLALFPDDRSVREVWRAFKKRFGCPGELPAGTLRGARTPLLDALVREYFSERVLERKPSAALVDLTTQILSESLRILLLPRAPGPAVAESEAGTPVTRALRAIETGLFGPLSMQAVARAAGVSQATLFRAFKREVGSNPGEYLAARRLDEARSLLQGGDYLAGDVALVVGYADLPSFSRAFKRRFGRPPSAIAGPARRPSPPRP